MQSSGQLEAKSLARAGVLAARRADTTRERADAARLPRLLDACAGHATVACYLSVPPEPDTTHLIAALQEHGVAVLLPVLAGHREPAWAWYAGLAALRPGWHGIPEPTTPTLGAQALASCSFVWVSALQVTAHGDRLGTGGGWYDRALVHAAPDAVIATLVSDGEVVPDVPVEEWDRPVDLIVTPTRTLSPMANRS